MNDTPGALAPNLPHPPFDVVVLGDGRVGGSLAAALERAGHRILARLGRADDPSPIADADVVAIAVPDDALDAATAVVARSARPGAVVFHTCGIAGIEPLRDCGSHVAALHPAIPVPTPQTSFVGAPFGVTCASGLEQWCDALVRSIGGVLHPIPAEQRVLYHAALVMASNFAVALAGDAADLVGEHELLVPLLRATVENIARLGPDAALTGPIVRGDAGTVRAHLAALPARLVEPYVVMARRALARAELTEAQAAAIEAALAEALVR